MGGNKLLCGPLLFCSTMKCGWLLPQILRDFRVSRDGTISKEDMEEQLIGLRCFLGPLARQADFLCEELAAELQHEGSAASLTQLVRGSSRAPRVAALDLGYALESALRSAGLSLSNFTQGS